MSDLPVLPKNSSDSIKKRQYRRAAGVVAGVLAVTALGIYIAETSQPPKPPPPAKPVTTNIAAPGSQVNPKDAWRVGADTQMSAMEKQNKDLLDRIKRLEGDGEKNKEGLTAFPPEPQKTAPEEPKDAQVKGYIQREKDKLLAAAQQGEKRLPPPVKGAPTATVYPPNNPQTGGESAPVAEVPRARGISIVSLDVKPSAVPSPPGAGSAANAKPASADDTKEKGGDARKTVDNYLSIGHMQIELLGGLDAPSGGQSQANPLPIYFRVKDNGYHANGFRSRVKECLGIGTGYGDLASERAILRVETLSCTMADGTIVETQIKGTIFGEDGKVGLHGHVVTKTGQMLANSLAAGIASGIGHAFTQSATTQSISPLGTTSTVEPGKQFQAGIGTGVGKALDELARYWIRLADKSFPVVEVMAGRTGDLVIQKGDYIDFPVSVNDDASELDKRNRRMNRDDDYND